MGTQHLPKNIQLPRFDSFSHVVVVVPDNGVFHALAKQAETLLSCICKCVTVLPHAIDSLKQDFSKRRKKVRLLCALDEHLYCLYEARFTPWTKAMQRVGLEGYASQIGPTHSLKSRDFYSFFDRGEKTLLVGLGCGYIRIDQLPCSVTPVNIHPGILPFYPGLGNPEAYAGNDFGRMGVTVHLMTKRIDAGPILVRRRITLLKLLDIPTAYLYAYKVGLEELARLVSNGPKQVLEADKHNVRNSPQLQRLRLSFLLFASAKRVMRRFFAVRTENGHREATLTGAPWAGP